MNSDSQVQPSGERTPASNDGFGITFRVMTGAGVGVGVGIVVTRPDTVRIALAAMSSTAAERSTCPGALAARNKVRTKNPRLSVIGGELGSTSV
jgi:hypothetical protein